jgi:hypothetical protein
VLGRRPLLVGLAAVFAAVVVGLARTGPPGALNSIWAEDGWLFLSDAETMPWYQAVVQQRPGYVLFTARLLTEPASVLPIEWAAAFIAIEAALVTALLAVVVYVASRAHFDNRLSRLAVAVPAAVPAGFPPNALATLQFTMLYASLWMVLWNPTRLRDRLLALAIVALTAANTVLAATLLPVLAVRLLYRRDRSSLLLGLALVPGLLLQVTPHLHGAIERPDARWAPLWAVREYVRWGVPGAVFGPKWTMPLPSDVDLRYALIASAWLIVAVAVVFAWRGRTRANWPLAAVAGGYAVQIGLLQIMAQGETTTRYLVPITLAMITAMVALLQPIDDSQPLVAFVTLVAIVASANLRVPNPRDHIAPWDLVVRGARAECRADPALDRVVVVTGNHAYGWTATLPCHRLR